MAAVALARMVGDGDEAREQGDEAGEEKGGGGREGGSKEQVLEERKQQEESDVASSKRFGDDLFAWVARVLSDGCARRVAGDLGRHVNVK